MSYVYGVTYLYFNYLILFHVYIELDIYIYIYDWESQKGTFPVFGPIGVTHTVGKPMKRAFQRYATRSGWVAGRVELPQSCGASRVTARVVLCEHVIEKNVFKVY